MKRLLMTLAGVLAACGLATSLTACGGSDSATAGKSYSNPMQIVKALRAAGATCVPDGPAMETLYSQSTLTCWTPNAYTGHSYDVSVYGSTDEEAQAKDALTQQNPGTRYVWGNRWSVSVAPGMPAQTIADVLG